MKRERSARNVSWIDCARHRAVVTETVTVIVSDVRIRRRSDRFAIDRRRNASDRDQGLSQDAVFLLEKYDADDSPVPLRLVDLVADCGCLVKRGCRK